MIVHCHCVYPRKQVSTWCCLQETSFVGKRMYSFTWFFYSHQFMTISFYVALVLHPLPGRPGNPRPHSSTTWVCPHTAALMCTNFWVV